jgi:CarD family transcriptional regulator
MTAAPKTAARPAPKPAPEAETPEVSPAPPTPEAEATPATPAAVERDAMPPPGPRPVLPQRAIAKAENFKPGDHVVYPTHGVGKVDRIAPEEIAGQKLELIHITFDENRMTLRVPVNKARTAGLRKLSSKKSFDEVLATLKGRARIKRTMWSRRAQEYEAKINSGDPMAIAEVVRDLHRNAGQPDQSFSERQIFEAALERLAAEYGALEGLGKQEAIDKLLLFLKTE